MRESVEPHLDSPIPSRNEVRLFCERFDPLERKSIAKALRSTPERDQIQAKIDKIRAKIDQNGSKIDQIRTKIDRNRSKIAQDASKTTKERHMSDRRPPKSADRGVQDGFGIGSGLYTGPP